MSSDLCVDTSVWIAILLEEPGFEAVTDSLAEASRVWIGAAVLAESLVVLEGRKIPHGTENLARLLQAVSV